MECIETDRYYFGKVIFWDSNTVQQNNALRSTRNAIFLYQAKFFVAVFAVL